MAREYDEHLEHDCGYRSPGELAKVVDALEGTGDWLDLGAGTGLLGDALARRGLDLRLVGLDVSAQMLAQVSSSLYVECHRCDVLSRIPGRRRFDGAVASGLLEYVLDVPALTHRVAKRLRARGAFVFTFVPSEGAGVTVFDDEADLHAHDPAHVVECLRGAGFGDIEISEPFAAYRNGEQGWIHHRVARAHRGLAATS